MVGMAVKSTISESLSRRNTKKKARSIIRFLICSKPSIDPYSSSGSSSPEKTSPVQMPHFMKATASYDAKKETSLGGGIECEDAVSVDSSKSVNHENKIKNSKGVRKAIKNFGSTRSFRRRGAAKVQSQRSVETPDSSPNYMKAASCSEGKNGHFQETPRGSESSFDSSDQSQNLASSSSTHNNKSFQTLMRSSSLRAVRVSFKSRKHSMKVKIADKATCSSTIKDKKFHGKVELLPGQAESERLSVYNVCSYHHCSLHGHSHDSSSDPPKRFNTRRFSKPEKNTKPRNKSIGTKELKTTQMSQKPTVSVTENSGVREETQSYADLVEIAFGETSFPERNYQETLNQMGKTADCCCCWNSVKVDPEEFRGNQEEIDARSESEKSLIVESKNLPEVVDSEAKSSSLKTKHLSMWKLIQQHMVSGSNNKPSNGSDEEENHGDNSNELPSPESSDSSNADVTTANLDGENQDIEVRKLFAIKLIREAIETILLPEVSDQSSDDQSVTSETTPDQETFENDKDNDSICKEKLETIREAKAKSENTVPKHWSNLKKWILLQRFIKELEKVKTIDARKSRQIKTEQNPGSEKVHLRPQTVEERKRTEEWMLDYALRQAINQLAPVQKRKVELLVRAFETVVPPQGGNNNIQVALPKLKSIGEEHMQMTTKENEFSSESNGTVHELLQQNKVDDADNDVLQGNNGADMKHMEKGKYISMWHMISQHVLSGVVSKVGIELLDGTDDEVEDAANSVVETKTHDESCQHLSKPNDQADLDHSSHHKRNFSKDDAIKLVREAVNEILVTQVQDETNNTLPEQVVNQNGDESAMSEESLKECNKNEAKDESIMKEHEKKEVCLAKTKPALSKSKNWSKLKKILLLKRSIAALENARKLKFPPRQELPQTPNPEPEKVDLRHQMTDERKKAEQWMLDYAVQNIVTKLTPARKRRVAMLVEAFEAVVPLPEI